MQIYWKRDSSTVVFLSIFRNFSEHFFYRTPLVAASAYCKVSGSQVKFCAKNWRQSITNDNYILWLHCRIECVHNDIDQLFISIETRESSKCEKTSLKHQIYGVIFHSIQEIWRESKYYRKELFDGTWSLFAKLTVFILLIWFNIHIIVASH